MSGVVVLGDALLDRDLEGTATRLAPDAPVPVVDSPVDRPRPGGAGLAAVLAAADGVPVTLVTALGHDEAGARVRSLVQAAGVDVVDLGLDGRTPEKVRVRASGQSLVRMDHGGPPGRPGPLTGKARQLLEAAAAVLVSDYGRGLTAAADVRAALAAVCPSRPVVWDPHPRGAAPVPGARIVTPNHGEAQRAAGSQGLEGLPEIAAQARALLRRWAAAGVAVTLGPGGALLVGGDGTPVAVPAEPVTGGDACGAGDRFASRAAVRLATGALPSEAVTDAVAAATQFVAAGGASRWPHHPPSGGRPERGRAALKVIGSVRAGGGTVVATGGCFDLLHAGHVQMLAAARALGDCLVVCLNSDDSVRRLKGPDRPLVTAHDRAAVLAGLRWVDAVTVFDEDTPEAVLATLRPDVWVKGGDYAVEDLPEAALVASWGGQALVLPYLAGRSTTGLLAEALTRNRH